VPVRPAVKVTNSSGQPACGVVVTFSVRSGGGAITGEVPTTNEDGIATLGSWTLGSTGGNSLFATLNGASGSPIIFVATATLPAGSGVRIVTFGDSNTDVGWSGTNPNPVASSYISSTEPRMSAGGGNNPTQLAGKIEARWGTVSAKPIMAVNHAISATSTGAGRTPRGAPNAREAVGGITRFDGEVMGSAYPWNGGEPTNSFYPSGSITRTKAYSPGANDFVYVSMGTNDPGASIPAAMTAANLEWMIDMWVNSGHAANHFLLTTLAPANGAGNLIASINDQIRALAARRGVRLIDISARTSNDNSLTWKSASDHIGDGVHYSEAVRDWIADQVVSIMAQLVPN
jgi:lysophospholipase L1-like esterase